VADNRRSDWVSTPIPNYKGSSTRQRDEYSLVIVDGEAVLSPTGEYIIVWG
jgi:hypothetical protein